MKCYICLEEIEAGKEHHTGDERLSDMILCDTCADDFNFMSRRINAHLRVILAGIFKEAPKSNESQI